MQPPVPDKQAASSGNAQQLMCLKVLPVADIPSPFGPSRTALLRARLVEHVVLDVQRHVTSHAQRDRILGPAVHFDQFALVPDHQLGVERVLL